MRLLRALMVLSNELFRFVSFHAPPACANGADGNGGNDNGNGDFSIFFRESTMLENEGRCLGSLHDDAQDTKRHY